MAEVYPTLLIALAVVMGLLLTISVLAGLMARARQMRPARAAAGNRGRGQWKAQGQQLESRQLLDAGMGNETLPIEGESLTIGGVTYENVDFKALAQAIADSGAKFYGADWCPLCTQQKAMFREGYDDLPFFEVTNPDRSANALGLEQNITQLPTWVFADNTRVVDVLEIEELLQYTGVTIPQAEPIHFDEIPDQTNVISGQSYHIPLDGYSPTGESLTYTVTSSSGTVIASVMQGNKSLRITSNQYGTMEFYLFEEEAGRATSRIIELAESGFYDGLTFHRTFTDFVLQGGDPNGNGSGGSTLGDFDDQFDPDLRHNGTGILSFAKSFDDTNDSQFFIMEGRAAHLDFQHTVFGFMTEGEKVREGISRTPTHSNNAPKSPVVMNEVSTFIGTQNGVLRLKIPEGATGTETITVMVSDGQGNTLSRSFDVQFAPNSDYSTVPYLSFIPDVAMPPGSTYSFQLNVTNLEGDELVFYDEADFDSDDPNVDNPFESAAGLVYSINSETGFLEIEARSWLAPGVYEIVAAVSNDLNGQIIAGSMDFQMIQVTVADRPTLHTDEINLNEDESVTFNPLDNDADTGSTFDPSTLRLVTQPALGELTVDPQSGDITYTPPADFHGTVYFQYNVTNVLGLKGASPATVVLTVGPVNDEPEALDDVFLADRDTASLLPVLLNDDKGGSYEANSSVLVALPSSTTAAGGSVSVVGSNVQYTPAAGFTGSDTFTYTIVDGGFESTATVTVDVRDVSNFMISAVKGLTETGGDSIFDFRPQSDQIIGEWDSFWVEVWVTPEGTGGNEITAAAATLNFDSSIFRANSIVVDSAFTASTGTAVNNSAGTATIRVASSGVTVGAGERIRLGRIRFQPVANGLDAPEVGDSLGVDFNAFLTSLTDASLTVNGVGEVDSPTADFNLPSRILPMVYDLNDDGKVGIADFSVFLGTIGNSNSTAFVDFDLSGDIYGSGFSYFRSAIGSSYTSLNPAAAAWPSGLLDAAMSDFIVTPQVSAENSFDSLSGEDVAIATTALPPVTDSIVAGNPTNVVTIQIVDLPGSQLASTIGNSIYLDHNAAGWGWFVDSTPLDSSEFSGMGDDGQLVATSTSAASGKIDLLSVLMHELGHVAGLPHSEFGLMSGTILPGERLVDWDRDGFEESFYVSAVDEFFSSEDD